MTGGWTPARRRVVAAVTLCTLAACGGGTGPGTPTGEAIVTYGPCGNTPHYFDQVTTNRWASFPLTFFIDDTALEEGLRVAAVRAVEEGVAEWRRAGRGLADLTRATTRSPASIVFEFGVPRSPADPGQTVTALRGDVIFGATVTVNLAALEAAARLPSGAEAFVRRVAAHEAGHALGIASHSTISGTLMVVQSRDADGVGAPGEQDLNTLREIYCQAP